MFDMAFVKEFWTKIDINSNPFIVNLVGGMWTMYPFCSEILEKRKFVRSFHRLHWRHGTNRIRIWSLMASAAAPACNDYCHFYCAEEVEEDIHSWSGQCQMNSIVQSLVKRRGSHCHDFESFNSFPLGLWSSAIRKPGHVCTYIYINKSVQSWPNY